MQKVKKTAGHVFACLCMVFFLLISGGQDMMAQEAKNVSLKLEKVTAKEFFDAVQKQTGLNFVYDARQVQDIPPISVQCDNESVWAVLNRVMKKTAFTYKVEGNFITLVQGKALRKVTGMVKDEEGMGLPGVNVYIKDSKYYAVTDMDGKYSLNIPFDACKVTYSYIGMESQDLAIVKGDKSMVKDITLRNSSQLEEVVVNGFFTRSKQTFTGAAKTYSSEELLKISPTNIFQALSTLDAGMTIAQNNAAGSNPNNIPDLVIRSTTSLATDNEVGLNAPLIVIDGVETNLQALYDIDMQDIERVDVLKDASATALYGENAANGVIVIERKRVSQAPVRVRYSFTPQVSFADLSSYDLCNAAQKLELERMAGLYDSKDGSLDQKYYDKLALVSSGLNTDWISKPVRNSFSHDHSISISGRGAGLDYNVTGNYSNTAGVMKDDSRARYGMNVYLSYRAIDKLILTLRASHEELKQQDSPYGQFSEYCEANPYDSPYDEMGNFRPSLSYNMNNPLYEASLSSFKKNNTRKQTISLDARYNFRPNLYVTAQGSYVTSRGTSDEFISPESNRYAYTTALNQKGSYQLGNSGAEEWSTKLVGNWIHSFDDEGTMLTVNLGGEIKRSKSFSRYVEATGFLSDDLADIVYATNYSQNTPGGQESIAASVGMFVAGNFVWKNRYIVDGSYRVSGSSKFGEDNRYAPFWSAGLGYNLHNEEFIKDLGWVNTLRLRGSYGFTGSVKFDAYQAVTTYKYSSDYLHYAGVGAIPMAMSNPDLTWQTTKKLNIGLTSSFFGDRMNVNFDYYKELTDDMLIDMSLPPSSGATKVKNNLGSQESHGIEFSLWGKVIKTRDWEWNLSVNGLHNKTKIKEISDALKRKNDQNGQQNTYNPAPRHEFRENESPTSIFAVRSAGVDPASGKEIFIKKDGTYTYTYDPKDKVKVGDTNPALQGSISSMLIYKRFSLSMNFSYRFGGDVYNSTRASKVENINPQKNADVRAFTERWQKPGDVKPYLNIAKDGGKNFTHTDRFVEKDNEFWFSSLNFQYNVPDEWAKKIHAQKLFVGVGTEDLFRLTSAKYERGTSYPFSRSVNFSLSVTF